MTSYNHEQFVGEAIQSVLDQDFIDWELVIRDDGSTDGTSAVIERFRDPRVRYLGSGRNLGASLSANEAIKAARGKYVAILNSDDAFEPHKLRLQHDFLESHPGVGAVFSQALLISEDGSPFTRDHLYAQIFDKANRSRQEWLRYFFSFGNCLCDPSVLVRREVYDAVGLYDARFASLPDFDLWVRVCLRYEIHILPDKLVKFRLRANEENESGQRPANVVRLHAEMFHCVALFRQLSGEDFRRVFPGVAEPHADGWFDVEFHLARHCLAQPQAFLQSYGEQLLHEITRDEARMSVITAHTGFGYPHLHAAMAGLDLYHVASPAYQAPTRLLLGAADCPSYVASAALELGAHGRFECCYEVPGQLPAGTEMWWEPPAGMPCVISIQAAECGGQPVGLSPGNADQASNGEHWFHRVNPRYHVQTGPVEGPAFMRIKGTIRMLEPQDLVAEIKGQASRAKTLTKEAVSLQKQLKHLEKENQALNKQLDTLAASPLRAFRLWWTQRHHATARQPSAVGSH